MASHTPGPWAALKGTEDESERWGVYQDTGPAKWHLATIENGAPGDTLKTEESNARLIAAAPDLLAACVALVRWRDGGGGNLQRDDVIAAARAAIAKATEGTP